MFKNKSFYFLLISVGFTKTENRSIQEAFLGGTVDRVLRFQEMKTVNNWIRFLMGTSFLYICGFIFWCWSVSNRIQNGDCKEPDPVDPIIPVETIALNSSDDQLNLYNGFAWGMCALELFIWLYFLIINFFGKMSCWEILLSFFLEILTFLLGGFLIHWNHHDVFWGDKLQCYDGNISKSIDSSMIFGLGGAVLEFLVWMFIAKKKHLHLYGY